MFNSHSNADFYLADQIPTSFFIQENDELRVIPLRIPNKEFKDHVYRKYVKALTKEEILFPYPPETLEQAITFEMIPITTERGEKLDIFAIGAFLKLVLSYMSEEKG